MGEKEKKLFKKLLRDVIQYGDPDRQSNILKIFYAFKIGINIIKLWKKTYHFVCSKNSTSNKNDNIFQTQPVNAFYWQEAIRNDIQNNERTNVVAFIIIAVKYNYLEITDVYLREIIEFMKSRNENPEYINILVLHLTQMITGNSDTIQDDNESKQKYKFTKNGSSLFDAIFTSNTVYKTIFDINSWDFALYLSIKYSNIFSKITVRELITSYMNDTNTISGENCKKLCDEFNKLVQLVYTQILITQKTDDDKKRVIKKFIDIAEYSLKLNNYTAFFSIISALHHNMVQRIKKLWKVKYPYVRQLALYEKIIDGIKNSQPYRSLLAKMLEEKNNYIVPHIGIMAKDIKIILEVPLINIDTQNFNWDKCMILAKTITEFEKIRATHKYPRMNDTLIDQFYNKIIICYNDNELDIVSKKYIGREILPEPEFLLPISKPNPPVNEIQLSLPLHKIVDEVPPIPPPREPCTPRPVRSPPNKSSPRVIDLSYRPEKSRPVSDKAVYLARTRSSSFSDVVPTPIPKTTPRKITRKPSSLGLPSNRTSIAREIRHDKNKLRTIPIDKWNVEQVTEWLIEINMEKYTEKFRSENINGIALSALTINHLKNELDVATLGERLTIIKKIEKIKNHQANHVEPKTM